MRRLRKLALAFLACLLFAVLAPMYFAERHSDEPFAISPVIASPRDMHMLTLPVKLSDAPDLTLTRARRLRLWSGSTGRGGVTHPAGRPGVHSQRRGPALQGGPWRIERSGSRPALSADPADRGAGLRSDHHSSRNAARHDGRRHGRDHRRHSSRGEAAAQRPDRQHRKLHRPRPAPGVRCHFGPAARQEAAAALAPAGDLQGQPVAGRPSMGMRI